MAATLGLNVRNASAAATSASATTTRAAVDVTRALSCLRLTTPDLNLSYPADAEAHFEEINTALERWKDYAETYYLARTNKPYFCSEGFCGPWLENLWITRCNELLAEGKPLSAIFGPYIPILVPFVDTWSANVFEYENMVETMKRVLRPTVPYVAMVQSGGGLIANRDKCKDVMKVLPNLLVISSGGYGHVPVPLFKQPEPLNKFAKPVAQRRFLTSYMGSPKNAPQDMRQKMISTVQRVASNLSSQVYIGYGGAKLWHEVMGNSRASLCPRGYGRTSFHVYETLQMGHVPVHVYLDIPWLPYPELFPSIGFNSTVEGLPRLLEELKNMSNSSLEAMETRVRELRESHFTMDGLLEQTFRLLSGRDGGSDLRCQRLPKTVTR